MTREELQLESEWLDLSEAFIAAKATRDTDPGGYAAAKVAMSTFRTFWRQIRELYAQPADGVAVVASIKASSKVKV